MGLQIDSLRAIDMHVHITTGVWMSCPWMSRSVSFMPGRAQRVGPGVLGQLLCLSRHLRLVFRR